MQRDPKSLYKKAIAGEIKSFTGVNDPYELPAAPELVVETHKLTLLGSVDTIIRYLNEKGLIDMGERVACLPAQECGNLEA